MKLRTLCKARRDQFLIRFSCLKPGLLSSSLLTSRREKGQAIAEGAAVMVPIVMVAVVLIALFLNTYAVTQNQYKASIVAEETARSLQADLYWFNCIRRQDFNKDSARDKATNVAQTLAVQLQMPPPASVAVVEAPIGLGPNPDQGEILKVILDFPTFSLPFQLGGLFPSVFHVTGTGVSAAAISRPYLFMHYNALIRDGYNRGGNPNPHDWDDRLPDQAFTTVCPTLGYFMSNASSVTNHEMNGMPPALFGPYAVPASKALIGYSGFYDPIRAHPVFYNANP